MKKFLTIIFALLTGIYMSCSTGGSGSTTNENLVTKTWYSLNNGNWTGNYSGATWLYTFEDCEEISDTEFYVIQETRLYFYTAMPSIDTKRRQTAERARAECSNWIYYNKFTDGYKKSVTTLNNGAKFYRNKINKAQYASIY